jgi:hypothetical protein
VSVVAAKGLTLVPSYRPGCGFTAMPGNELVFPVANKQDSSWWAACSYLIYLSPYLIYLS